MSGGGDLERILAALGRSGGRHLVVGGVAVVLHGHPRMTADLDLVVQLESQNALRVLAALKALDYRPRAPVPVEDFADEGKRTEWMETKGLTVFSLWSPTFPATEVDLFVQEPFDFELAYARAIDVHVGGETVKVAAIEDLIALKRAAGRDKDQLDIEALTRIQHDDGVNGD